MVECSHRAYGHERAEIAQKVPAGARRGQRRDPGELTAELSTSSYRAWRPELGAPVVTPLTTPKWLREATSWPKLTEVTPRWSYFHDDPDIFTAKYLDQL